jgi:hypothetical protein
MGANPRWDSLWGIASDSKPSTIGLSSQRCMWIYLLGATELRHAPTTYFQNRQPRSTWGSNVRPLAADDKTPAPAMAPIPKHTDFPMGPAPPPELMADFRGAQRLQVFRVRRLRPPWNTHGFQLSKAEHVGYSTPSNVGGDEGVAHSELVTSSVR